MVGRAFSIETILQTVYAAIVMTAVCIKRSLLTISQLSTGYRRVAVTL